MVAAITLIGLLLGIIGSVVAIIKDGPGVVRVLKRAMGLPERIDPMSLATRPQALNGGGGTPNPNIGGLATGVALGGASVALAAEILTHHGGHAHDLATATGELMNAADPALIGDLQALADLPVEAASDLMSALGELLRL